MANIKLGNKEMTLGDILMAVGGLIMFICLFLTWSKITATGIGSGNTSWNITGINFLNGNFQEYSVKYVFIAKAPLIAAIIGILAIAAAVVPMFAEGKPRRIIRHVGAALSIVAFVFCLLFMIKGGKFDIISDATDSITYNSIKVMFDMEFWTMKLAFGSILALIASILATAGGILNIFTGLNE